MNTNGSLDTSFNGSGIAAPQNGYASAVAVDTSGRVIALGADNESAPFVWRFRTDGHLDGSFGTGGAARIAGASNASGLAVDTSGRVVFDGVDSNGTFIVERLAANGTPDATFGTNGRTNISLFDLRGIAIQGDGRILVSGTNTLRMGVTRLLSNGGPDASFGTHGTSVLTGLAAHTSSSDVKILPGGGLLVVGSGGNTTTGLGAYGVAARLLADGHLDTSFACAGAAWSHLTKNNGGFQSVAVGTGSAFVLGRGTTSESLAVQRLDLSSSGPNGYAIAASDGGAAAFGSAAPCSSVDDLVLRRPLVGLATTPTGHGRWLVTSDGGVLAAGDAQLSGSTANLVLNRPIVGIAATPSGHGYWLTASDGGVFSYGDARYFGSTGAIRLNQPVVGIAATATGDGYWLAARDGGIFSFGRAPFRGSSVPNPLATNVIGIAATP